MKLETISLCGGFNGLYMPHPLGREKFGYFLIGKSFVCHMNTYNIKNQFCASILKYLAIKCDPLVLYFPLNSVE